MKTVLLFRTSYWMRNNGQSYRQILDFAAARGWRLQSIEYINATTSALWQDAPAPLPKVRELINIWKPDGCIVEAGGVPDEPWQSEFGDVPVVYIDRPSRRLARNEACLMSNDKALAQTAAKELLRLQLDNFAYAACPEDRPWNLSRLAAFRQIIEQHGKQFSTFKVMGDDSARDRADHLVQTLVSLPKPCGIFTANDGIGAKVIAACHHAGIAVPDEIAVVSVDNDVSICEHLPVSLTSIEQDRANSGRIAVELLDSMMSGAKGRNRIRFFDIARVVRRASANGLRNVDRRIASAIEFIRTNACKSVTPADVAEKMGCSIRHAHRLFLNVRRHTILDEIHLRRIGVAKEQLQAHILSFESIAELCGYSSLTDFGRVFKRYTGLTPRSWQKQQCKR